MLDTDTGEQNIGLIQQSFKDLVSTIGHGHAAIETQSDGTILVENTEGEGILGLGYDATTGEVWLCPTQSTELFQRNNGWNANDEVSLAPTEPDPGITDSGIEIGASEHGDTIYRFPPDHWLTKFHNSMNESGVDLNASLHVAQQPDWSDAQSSVLTRDKTGALVMANPFRGQGRAEMKLSIRGLGVQSWSAGDWQPGAKQELRIKPAAKVTPPAPTHP